MFSSDRSYCFSISLIDWRTSWQGMSVVLHKIVSCTFFELLLAVGMLFEEPAVLVKGLVAGLIGRIAHRQ